MNIRKFLQAINDFADLFGENNLLHLCVCIIFMVVFSLIMPISWAAGITVFLFLLKELANAVLTPTEESYFRNVITWFRWFYNIFGTMLGNMLVLLIQKHYGVG